MLKIRLRRMGNRNRPYFRVVVSDSRKAPGSTSVEEIGHYDPTSGPDSARLDMARVDHWVERGASVSPAVQKLVRRQRAQSA